MTDASIDFAPAPRPATDRSTAQTEPFKLSRETVDALVVMAGSALMALGGVMLASYLMLPFGS